MDQHFPRCVHPVGSVDHRHHFSSSQAAPGRAEHRSQICSVPGTPYSVCPAAIHLLSLGQWRADCLFTSLFF